MVSEIPIYETASKLIQEAELLLVLQEGPHPSRTPHAGSLTMEGAGPLTSPEDGQAPLQLAFLAVARWQKMTGLSRRRDLGNWPAARPKCVCNHADAAAWGTEAVPCDWGLGGLGSK